MLYRALLILLLSVMAINPAIFAATPVLAAHAQMDCHGDHCDMADSEMTDCGMNSSDCCEAELPDCCLQLSAALFLMPAGLQFVAVSPLRPRGALSRYLSAIPPPVYHPPRSGLQSV